MKLIMSVSNPLINDLKSCAVRFLEEPQPITDKTESVQSFCEALERILQRGLVIRINAFGYWKDPEPWHWMEKISSNKYRAPYLYQLSVDKVRKCEKAQTNVGRTRLLIRHCLNNRCLHVPFELLFEWKQYKEVYNRESVLGSEILSQILMSVLLLPSRLQFQLDTDNARFLDLTWLLPDTSRLKLVPADKLGISLTFVEGKAVVVEVLPDSVASEDDQVQVGDVIDELNSVVIVAGLQGQLGQVMKKSGLHPITAYVIKGRHKGGLFGPLIPYQRKAGLNPSQILNNFVDKEKDSKLGMMLYIGHVLTGDHGDVKEIRRAINRLLIQEYQSVRVTLECQDIGVKVTRQEDAEVILKHSYMIISSCGCTVQAPNYFAYIVEDRELASENRFVCHVFHTENQELVDTILTSIGQGFKRTHFAV